MTTQTYTISNAVCIEWPITPEELIMEALRMHSKWFVLQTGERTVGCINREVLYDRVKQYGLVKSTSMLPIDDIIMEPVFVDNEGEIMHGLEKNKALILRDEQGAIKGVVDWELNEQIEELLYHDNWLIKEFETVFYDFYNNILVTDGAGNVIRATAEDDKKYIGKNVFDLEREREFYPSVTAKVLKTGKRERSLQYTKSGGVFTIESIPIKNDEGKIVRVVSITKEASEISELTKQLDEVKALLNSYQKEITRMKQEQYEQKPFIYKSKKMEDLHDLIRSVASVDTTILILGETGVGKELVAHQIHRLSNRRDKPFVVVNCGAIPENLLESELFGYKEGSFSGARKGGKLGIFEFANQGTVFLDEIGEMPLQLQVKLLRVLQEKKIMRIGDTQEKEVDVRIIAATNQNLEKMVQEKRFRQDLFYRLNVVPVHVPSLRERKEDIDALAFYFLNIFNKKYQKQAEITQSFLQKLRAYAWPGNIRELENTIERFVVTGQELPPQFDVAPENSVHTSTSDKELPRLFEHLENVEKQLLMEASLKCKTTREMAELLGINQSTVVRKMQKYNLYINKS